MTQDIIAMARAAGLPGYPDELKRFAALVAAASAAAEREACAKLCDEIYFRNYPDAEEWERSEEGETIRARGQA